MNIFLGPKRLLKTQFLEKKGKLYSEKKTVAYFFVVWNKTNVREAPIKVEKVS